MISRRQALQGLGATILGSNVFFIRGAAASDEIIVGSILDESGPIEHVGLPMVDATKFAIDHLNTTGGVLGKKVRAIHLNGQSDNALYTEYATKLILENELAVLMGGITSASREAMRPVVDKNKQLYFYNEQYEGGVCDKYVFCTGVTPSQQLGVLVPWATSEFGKKFYTLAADYNYGHISADWVKVYLKKAGGSLVGNEFLPLDVIDFTSVIQRIEQQKPDVIMSLLVGTNHIAFYRQFAAAGLNKAIPLVSATFGLGNEHIVLQPQEAEGIVVIYPYFQELDNPTNKQWVEAWHNRYGANYAYITDSCCTIWNGWHLWASAVNKAGSIDREKVTAALESGLSFDSPEGKITLDPQSHHVVHTVHMAKVNNNHGFTIFKTLEAIEPEDTKQVCNLIATPNQHTQYRPKF
jgi:branched-chain amino acid transport system substrate-binding protein